MEKRLRIIGVGGIGVLAVFVLGLFLFRTQAYQLFCREQQQLFLWNADYLFGLLSQPGGWAEVSARFVVQFFDSLKAGAVLTTLLLGMVVAAVCRILYRANVGVWALPLAFVPALSLAVSLLDPHFSFSGVTAYLWMVLFLAVYVSMPLHSVVRRSVFGITLSLLLFYAVGAAALLFAVCACLYDGLTQRSRWFMSLLYPTVVLLAAFGAVQGGFYGVYAYSFTPAGYYEKTIAMPFHPWEAWFALPLVLLSGRFARRVGGCSGWKQGACFLLLATAVAVSFHICYKKHVSPSAERFGEYEYLVVHEDWRALQKAASRSIIHYNDANYLNLALAKQGLLAEHLFRYPQFGPISLIFIPKDRTADVRLAYLHFAMGNMAAAQNVAFNALQAQNGYRPAMLRMLAQIELMRGSYAVAEKYLTLLEQSPHDAAWAGRMRLFLHDDRAVENDPLLGSGRKSLSDRRPSLLADSPMDDLYRIVAADPANGGAMQYALSYLLLAKDINHLQEFVDRYYGVPALPTLPTPVQEALLFFSDYYRTLTEAYALDHGITKEQFDRYRLVDADYCRTHGVSETAVARFLKFKELYEQVRKGAPLSLLDGYKQTFWYYLLFTQIDG